MFATNAEFNGHSSSIYRGGIPYNISLLFVVKKFHILYRLLHNSEMFWQTFTCEYYESL